MKKYNLWIIVEEHDTEAKGRQYRDLVDGPQVNVGTAFPTIEAAHEAAVAIKRMKTDREATG